MLSNIQQACPFSSLLWGLLRVRGLQRPPDQRGRREEGETLALRGPTAGRRAPYNLEGEAGQEVPPTPGQEAVGPLQGLTSPPGHS